MSRTYLHVADALEADIRAGRLAAGERLPPQRSFAFHRGLAVSTASRVYGELIRRGLATGEVGRGTYVRDPGGGSSPPPAGAASIDLAMNYPPLAEAAQILAPGLKALQRSDVLAAALRSSAAGGSPELQALAAELLAGPGWRPPAQDVVLTAGGRQALAAAISACVAPGERLAVEGLTYSGVKGLAPRLGVRLVPLALDEEGISPDALRQAAADGVRVVYLQPSLHNPLGLTMGVARRQALAQVLRTLDMVAIEDAVYRFLAPNEPPLAGFAPERVIHVDSLSKRLTPGLTLGFIAAKSPHREACAGAVRLGGWGPAGYALAAAGQWLADGAVEAAAAAKRRDARARQALARRSLQQWSLHGDPRAYHLWLRLPETWRAETFVAAAGQRGVRLVPGAAFAPASGHAPNAVRLALASPSLEALGAALDVLDQLLRAPDEALVD